MFICDKITREMFSKPEEYIKIKSGYNVNGELLQKIKKTTIFLRPLPWFCELSKDKGMKRDLNILNKLFGGFYESQQAKKKNP